jgi:hypothetical protein
MVRHRWLQPSPAEHSPAAGPRTIGSLRLFTEAFMTGSCQKPGRFRSNLLPGDNERNGDFATVTGYIHNEPQGQRRARGWRFCNSFIAEAKIQLEMKIASLLPGYCLTGVLLLIALGCKPKNQDLLVAHIEGDVFLPNLRAGAWNLDEGLNCQIASRTSMPPDSRGDLLLCGAKTQFAWSQTWLRADIRTQIYDAATKRRVNFQSSGHGGGRVSPPSWLCRRTPDEIDCD